MSPTSSLLATNLTEGIFILCKWSPYAKSNLTFQSLIENMSPHFQRLQAINDVLAFFSHKRNQKPLALAKHTHWSEVSLKLTCHQRKPHFLSSFLLLSSMKRSLMGTRIYHKKEFRISPWPFQKATSKASSQNLTFHKDSVS